MFWRFRYSENVSKNSCVYSRKLERKTIIAFIKKAKPCFKQLSKIAFVTFSLHSHIRILSPMSNTANSASDTFIL